jgi:hypothetical protein
MSVIISLYFGNILHWSHVAQYTALPTGQKTCSKSDAQIKKDKYEPKSDGNNGRRLDHRLQ